MLIRFNVKNFLSFNETAEGKSEEFSMIAGKVRKKSERIDQDGNLKLLKLATIFGANASGKSNLVQALDFVKFMVEEGFPQGYSELYCKTNEENKHKSSYFELEIKLFGKYYSYGFELLLSTGVIVSEWLLELGKYENKLIFSRSIDSGFCFGEIMKDSLGYPHLEVYSEDISEDNSVLFLSIMNQNKIGFYNKFEDNHIFKNIYEWITSRLNILYPNNSLTDFSYVLQPEMLDEVCRIISSFGTGIKNVQRVEVRLEQLLENVPIKLKQLILTDIEDAKIRIKNASVDDEDEKPLFEFAFSLRNRHHFYMIRVQQDEVFCETVKFSHGESNLLFNLGEESDGTVRVLDLIEILLSEGGKTYVIDELDRCLHPSLTYKFIEEFAKVAERRNVQLIVTTHESRLLDFDLLRRDEIWFINKTIKGHSNVYSLDQYNTRFDKKIDKAYLEGRYGGVPIFDTVFPIGEV